MPTVTRAVDPTHFRRVLGHYPTGVSIVTTDDGDLGPVGMTIGSLTSVSIDPPLVAFFPMKGSATFEKIRESGRFCVNVLGRDQEDLCRRFASRRTDKFDGVGWSPSPLGSPVIDGVLAWIDCSLQDVIEAGDHLIAVGAVDSLAVGTSQAPLMFFQGGYGRFSALSLLADGPDDIAGQLRLAHLARPHLEELSRQFQVEAHASALAGDHLIQLAWAGPEGHDVASRRVGLRLPFVPPMGILFAAWNDSLLRSWLEPWRTQSPVMVDGLHAQAAAARAGGWTATPHHESLQRVEAAVVELAEQGELPALRRRLADALAAYAREYVSLSNPSCGGAPVGTISFPVFDDRGQVALVLSAQGVNTLDHDALGECLAALRTAAESLTRRIGGTEPAHGN